MAYRVDCEFRRCDWIEFKQLHPGLSKPKTLPRPKGGIKRLTVSDEDKKVRDWFKAECEKLGCAVVVDEVGNMSLRFQESLL